MIKFIIMLLSTEIFGNFYAVFICFFGLFIIYLFKEKKISVPNKGCLRVLLLFELTYIIFSLIYRSFSLGVATFPIMFYFAGLFISKLLTSNDNYSVIVDVIKSFSIGLFFHAVLNYFYNIGTDNRNLIDIWTKIPLSATLQAIFVLLYNSFLFNYLFYEKNMIKKVLYFMGFFLSLLFLLSLGSRTGFLIVIIIFVINFIYYFCLNSSRSKKIIMIFLSVIFIVMASYLYNRDFCNIKSLYENSNLYYRLNYDNLDLSSDSRLEYQFISFKSIIKNFVFKTDLNDFRYSHNLWLDIGIDTGIIPFIFLLIFSIKTWFSLFKFLKLSNLNKHIKILLFSIYLSFNINFCVEPILQAFPFIFGIYCLISAMIDYQLVNIISNERRVNL